MKVVVLAAGYSVRLYPLTLTIPKPLLKIGGRSMLDRILDALIPLKDIIEGAYVMSNEKFFKKFKVWLKECTVPFEVTLMNDGTTSNETRLGAIRDLEMAIKVGGIDSDLLVIAGDNIFEFDVRNLLDFARARPDGVVVALHDIADIELSKKYGVTKVDKDSRIVGFEEKPAHPQSTLVSTGIYYFPRSKLHLVSEFIKSNDTLDAPGHYIRWLSERGEVYGFVFQEGWYDIGDMKSYEGANRKYKDK